MDHLSIVRPARQPGELRARPSGEAGQLPAGVVGDASRERSLGADDLDGIAGREVTLDAADAGREQAPSVLAHGALRPRVHDDAAPDAAGERDPDLAPALTAAPG